MYIGDSKIGRNDPCYCGSNKKYKHCHGKPEIDFYPKESFLSDILNIQTPNFVNNASEFVEVGRVDATFTAELPWDNEINSVLAPLINETWNVKDIWEKLI